MGTKDFSDWNGRKRKEAVRPAPVRDKWLRGAGKKEKVGIKTMVDRYKSNLRDLALYWKWRRESQVRRRELTDRQRRSEYIPNWSESVRWRIKKLRALQAEYQALGVYERVRGML